MATTITTIGGMTQDIMFYTNDVVILDNKQDLLRQKLIAFEYGAKIYSDQVYIVYGGGGANTAIGLASLGVKTQTILCLGDDNIGRSALAELKVKKVVTKLIQVSHKYKTGTSFIVNVGDHNEHVLFNYRGANTQIDFSDSVIKKIKTPWAYLASLDGRLNPKLNNLFEHFSKRKIKVAWNPGSPQLKLGLKKLAMYLPQTEVLMVNRDEALELLVSVGKVKDNIQQILKKLHQYGQSITVVTDGPKGAYVYDGNKVHFRPAFKKKGINTTGAGDSFGSGFVAGLIKYHSVTKALHLGILNSNSVVMKIGAQVGLLTVKDLAKHKL